MTLHRSHSGYAFLVSVLVIGTIAASAVATLLLLGTSVLRSTLSLESSARAQAAVMSCAERSLAALRSDLSYAGGETLILTGGATCRVLEVGGAGNAERTLCVEATDGTVVRRVEMTVTAVLPSTTIERFEEVADFSLCAS